MSRPKKARPQCGKKFAPEIQPHLARVRRLLEYIRGEMFAIPNVWTLEDFIATSATSDNILGSVSRERLEILAKIARRLQVRAVLLAGELEQIERQATRLASINVSEDPASRKFTAYFNGTEIPEARDLDTADEALTAARASIERALGTTSAAHHPRTAPVSPASSASL